MAREPYEGHEGDALEDGYTCVARRPRSASPGTFMPDEKASDFDEMSDMMHEYGGRESARRRRMRDPGEGY